MSLRWALDMEVSERVGEGYRHRTALHRQSVDRTTDRGLEAGNHQIGFTRVIGGAATRRQSRARRGRYSP